MPDQETPPPYKKVKVHMNLSRTRYVGYVHVYPPKTRVSDVLNEGHIFMTLSDVDAIESVAKGASLVVNKILVSYVQVVEEFKRHYLKVHSGEFVQVKIRMVDYQIEGELFIPSHMRGMDRAALLNRSPHFLNVRNCTVIGTRERYDFVAVSAHQIRSLEITE
jgi:hypothetical protein